MGLAFFLGGFNRLEQYYNVNVAQTVCMLLLLAVLSIVIPTCSRLLANASPSGILAQSRGTAIIVIFSYGLWLIFQFKTHREMLTAPAQKAPKRNKIKEKGDASRGIAFVGASLSGYVVEVEEEEEPQLSAPVACFTLIFSTVLVAFNTEFATSSIRPLLDHVGLSQSFFGLVIIPLLSLEPTSIVAAIKDKMHLTVALTLERCMQTALMVVPITILLGWCMSVDEMTLEFDGFSIAALFASIIIVAHVVQEGKSNWYVISFVPPSRKGDAGNVLSADYLQVDWSTTDQGLSNHCSFVIFYSSRGSSTIFMTTFLWITCIIIDHFCQMV